MWDGIKTSALLQHFSRSEGLPVHLELVDKSKVLPMCRALLFQEYFKTIDASLVRKITAGSLTAPENAKKIAEED